MASFKTFESSSTGNKRWNFRISANTFQIIKHPVRRMLDRGMPHPVRPHPFQFPHNWRPTLCGLSSRHPRSIFTAFR
jgi:hypothetical protein